ncbi:hypothetical protein [uncultured Kiloniella sp.]|uniref:hypothetical protein n=1 Tax=uncultured Kiloniella sp. TaxID=1133091 RepID=UPI0026131027|nr:hypothetical protein [uncultured Kiloniella sp.]
MFIKYVLGVVGAIFIGLAGTASAQSNAKGMALESFSKVAASWHFNRKCSYLSSSDLSDFEADVAYITITLGKDLGGQTLLNRIQSSVKDIVYSEKYGDCEKTREMFDAGYKYTKVWSEQIRLILEKQG